MGKTSERKLIRSISSELAAYLKKGKINPDLLEKNISYEGIDRVQDLDDILGIHFSIGRDTVDYIQKLPERIRRIKSINETYTDVLRGEINGCIRWGKTLEAQAENNDRSLYVCGKPERNYNIDENLVMMELLGVLHSIYKELDGLLKNGYKWPSKYAENRNFIDTFIKLYRRNVHLNRILTVPEGTATSQQISRAYRSRKVIYRNAAELLIRYRNRSRSYKDIDELLTETLVVPGEKSTLFELYSLFGIIRSLEDEKYNFKIKRIERGCSEIAVLKSDDFDLKVYHDSTAIFKINEPLSQLTLHHDENSSFFQRKKNSWFDTSDILFKSKWDGYNILSGRPDILIVRESENETDRIVIGEVKYARSANKFKEGVEDLIRYIHFIKDESGNYLLEREKDVMGVLVIDGMEPDLKSKTDLGEISDIDLDYSVHIITTREIEDQNIDFLTDFLT